MKKGLKKHRLQPQQEGQKSVTSTVYADAQREALRDLDNHYLKKLLECKEQLIGTLLTLLTTLQAEKKLLLQRGSVSESSNDEKVKCACNGCNKQFYPRHEHHLFCSSQCRIDWRITPRAQQSEAEGGGRK